jgi:glycosyltransferase involved in cell wall biosynthesis
MPRPVLFLAWVRHHGRTETLANALGAEPVFMGIGTTGNRWSAPIRQVTQAFLTVSLLLRRRPRALIVQAPPALLLAVAGAYGILARRPVVADAHTSAVVLATGTVNPSVRLLWGMFRAVIVHNTALAEIARSRARTSVLVLHNPPIVPSAEPGAAHEPTERFRVVYPCSWYADEPLEEVVEAARLAPEIEVVLTGRKRRDLAIPANVTLTGYVSDADYQQLIAGADALLALTTRELAMQQAGYEALAHGIPLVASDSAVLREYFEDAAVFTANRGEDLARALREARNRAPELRSAMARLAARRRAEFELTAENIGGLLGLRQPDDGA